MCGLGTRSLQAASEAGRSFGAERSEHCDEHVNVCTSVESASSAHVKIEAAANLAIVDPAAKWWSKMSKYQSHIESRHDVAVV